MNRFFSSTLIFLLTIFLALFPGVTSASIQGNIFHTSDADFSGGTKSQTEVDTGNGRVRLTIQPWVCGTSSLVYGGLTYGTVTANSQCWTDRNLGATAVATAYNSPTTSYGWYFQWGRLLDGHQISTSGTTNTPSTTDVPGHSNFIRYGTGGDFPDWRNPANDNLWGSGGGYINNPCPTAWHVPTQPEWSSVVSALGITNYTTAASSVLKLPAAGRRDTNGTLGDQGASGYLWSNTPGSETGRVFQTWSSGAQPNAGMARANGASVRCILNDGYTPSYYLPYYYSSGTYTSTIFQRAQVASWGNLTYNTPSSNPGLGIKVRTCAVADCTGATDWGSCSAITSGHALSEGDCINNSQKYIQYRAEFTSDTTNTAYLDDITLDYLYNPDVSIMSGIVKFFGNIKFK